MTDIRHATIADAEVLTLVERAAAQAFRNVAGLERIAEGEPTSPEGNRALISNGTVLVAQHGDRIVGFVAGYRAGADFHVAELSVMEEMQGQGTGRRLMQAIEVAARSHGATALTLTTFRDLAFNERFYAKLGFMRLDMHETDERLRGILASEAARGLPAHRRCAMRLRLQ